MKLFEKMRQQKFLSTTLLLITLSVGIVIGTLVNTSVNAARGQQVAPDATPLVITRRKWEVNSPSSPRRWSKAW
jgi:serine protease Do